MRARWIVAPAAAGLAALACVAMSARAASDPAAELADKYAPVVKIVKQTEPCGHGEPFLPSNVNVVFGRDEVALRGPWQGSNLVKVAPTAQDIATGRLD